MTTEQEGVSPATAGGASRPDLRALAAWLTPILDEVRKAYEAAIGAPFDESEQPDPRDAEIYDLHAQLGYTVKEIAKALGLPVGTDTSGMVAEIDRLHGDLHRIREMALVVLNRLPDDEDRSAVDLVREILADWHGPTGLPVRYNEVRADRDRLRAELAEIRTKLAEVHDAAQYDDITTLRAVEMLADQRDSMMAGWGRCHTKHIDQQAELDRLRAELSKPIEPRRWVAGDPEPEVGTVVRRDTYEFTRHIHGWHRNGACKFTADECPNRGGSWVWMTSTGRPLYEVVSTDG